MANAGRVAIVPQDTYNNTKNYKRLDMVSYASGLYVAKDDVPAGTLPTDVTMWMKIGDFVIQVMTEERNGIGRPDGVTIGVNENGVLSVIGNSGINFKKVAVKPTVSTAEENTVYLVQRTGATGENTYSWYYLMNGVVECINDYGMDWDDYLLKADYTADMGTASLKTTNKTVKGAINELHDEIGTETLETTAQTLTGAVNELHLGSGGNLLYSDVTVPVSAWIADNTYADYPYHADIALVGTKASYAPTVVFSVTDSVSGNFSPVAESSNGYVRIWASTVPASAITIPSIICEKNSTSSSTVIEWESNTAGFHNSIFRGQSIQSYFDDGSLWDRINGTNGYALFEDLFTGDYFDITISTAYTASEVVRCVIAGFGMYLHNGDTSFERHHAVIVPKNCFTATAQMNSTDTTGVSENPDNPSDKGGFIGSDMFQITLPIYATALQSALNNHILSHKVFLTNDMDSNFDSMAGAGFKGAAKNWEWISVTLSLLSEIQVYGSNVFSSSFYDTGCDNLQLPLFALDPTAKVCRKGGTADADASNRQWYWLRNIASAPYFALVNNGGLSDYGGASSSIGVRPLFCIG